MARCSCRRTGSTGRAHARRMSTQRGRGGHRNQAGSPTHRLPDASRTDFLHDRLERQALPVAPLVDYPGHTKFVALNKEPDPERVIGAQQVSSLSVTQQRIQSRHHSLVEVSHQQPAHIRPHIDEDRHRLQQSLTPRKTSSGKLSASELWYRCQQANALIEQLPEVRHSAFQRRPRSLVQLAPGRCRIHLAGVLIDDTELFNDKLQEWEHFYDFDRAAPRTRSTNPTNDYDNEPRRRINPDISVGRWLGACGVVTVISMSEATGERVRERVAEARLGVGRVFGRVEASVAGCRGCAAGQARNASV